MCTNVFGLGAFESSDMPESFKRGEARDESWKIPEMMAETEELKYLNINCQAEKQTDGGWCWKFKLEI